MFKNDLAAEWKRLNPRRKRSGAGLWRNLSDGFYQGWYRYFAPLRIIYWLFRRVIILLKNRLQG